MQQESVLEQQMEELLMSHYTALYRFAYRYVRNEEDAMDIVQESAYKAMKNCHSLREPQYAVTWLYRIVRNESVSFLRKKQAVRVPLSEFDGEREEHYMDFDLQLALRQLTREDRTVVLLRYFEGLSFQQMAEVMKENINTIKSRLYRALQKLRMLLGSPNAIL